MTEQTKLSPAEVATYSALFAFAQNFGYEWHETFIRWFVSEILAESCAASAQIAIRNVMRKEERPWSPYGAILAECRLVDSRDEVEQALQERKRIEDARVAKEGGYLPREESARRLRELRENLGKAKTAP